MNIKGDVLRQMLETETARDLEGNSVHINSAISKTSVLRIQKLVREVKPIRSLEVGCAMGISTLAILYEMANLAGASHTAIDPYQTGTEPDMWNGTGLSMVRAAGLSDIFHLIEQPSYLALPALVAEKRQFDFILIDGWHSFDYAFVDFFYSDLLLSEGGVLVFDDAAMPQVYQVCRFLETHKAYEKIGGAIDTYPLNPLYKVRQVRRRRTYQGSKGLSHEDPQWGALQGYRKVRNTVVPHAFYYSDFYPYFSLYRWWLRLRGLPIPSPTP